MNDLGALNGHRNIILIGGSQGAIPAVKVLLGGLPKNLRAAVGVTIHRGATSHSFLAELISKASALPVEDARHGRLFEPGRVYLAPPDYHLILRAGALWLDHGPKQHHVRPAVDAMFVSGARAYGARVVGVLLTGNLSDGVAGLISIKQHGGVSLAQDPAEAEAPSMPRHAIAYDDVDTVFRMEQAPALITELVTGLRAVPA